jgi:hypothetical protein
VKTACNHPDARAMPSGLDGLRLMKKRMRLREKKSVAPYRPDVHCLSPNAPQRTPNYNVIRSSKAYI